MIKKIAIAGVAAIATIALMVLLAGAGIVYLALSDFGLSLGQGARVLGNQRANVAAIRDAEGSIGTPDGIAEAGFVEIGGIEQWITIRGRDRRNPVILILHGGPGNALSQLAYYFRNWERDFTVVQWDQRGAGRTFGRYGTATRDMTIDRMVEDGAEVADYARRRLGQNKIILLGHSWGSALGVYLLKRHPELFSAYVGTGQIANVADVTAREYDYILARLTADHRRSALAELHKVGPPPYRTAAQQDVMQRWQNRYLVEADRIYLLSSIGIMLGDAKYSFGDLQRLQAGVVRFSIPSLYSTMTRIDLNSLGYDMPVPFCIIDGRDDRIAAPDLVTSYFNRIRAPQKAMMLIDKAGHFVMMSNPDEFLNDLVQCIHPLALEGARVSAPSSNK